MNGKNQYFLLNIIDDDNKKRVNKVKCWIEGKKFAPIFFHGHTIDQIKNKTDISVLTHRGHPYNSTSHTHSDAEKFVETFSKFPNTDDMIIFSISETKIYFFKQDGKLVPFKADEEHGVKGFSIKPLKEFDIKNCPLVLAGIKASLYLALGTFKELQEKYHLGNIEAIKYLLNNENASFKDFSDYLKCLSSVEFETLIAKIFEEKGFFVPAYKGGFLKNLDLVCRNSTEELKEIGGKEILPRGRITIQIKKTLKNTDYKEYEENSVDFYFCIDSELETKKNVFDAEYIKRLLYKSKTYDWLKETLDWADYEKSPNSNEEI